LLPRGARFFLSGRRTHQRREALRLNRNGVQRKRGSFLRALRVRISSLFLPIFATGLAAPAESRQNKPKPHAQQFAISSESDMAAPDGAHEAKKYFGAGEN
jgi:hypothetical protein